MSSARVRLGHVASPHLRRYSMARASLAMLAWCNPCSPAFIMAGSCSTRPRIYPRVLSSSSLRPMMMSTPASSTHRSRAVSHRRTAERPSARLMSCGAFEPSSGRQLLARSARAARGATHMVEGESGISRLVRHRAWRSHHDHRRPRCVLASRTQPRRSRDPTLDDAPHALPLVFRGRRQSGHRGFRLGSTNGAAPRPLSRHHTRSISSPRLDGWGT
jgi:hypothetical protein